MQSLVKLPPLPSAPGLLPDALPERSPQLPPYCIWQVTQSRGAGCASFGITAPGQTFGGVYTNLGLGTEMLIYNQTAYMAALQGP